MRKAITRKSRFCVGLLAVLAFAPASATAAEAEEFALEILPDRAVSYRMELPVVNPGRMAIEANWSGSRVLSFRLERPGGSTIRRSGTSPIRMEIEVDPEEAGRSRPWVLWIQGLSARSRSTGRLRIEMPVPSDFATTVNVVSPLPEAGEAFPWRQPAALPAALPGHWRDLHEQTERFRRLVVDASGHLLPDSHLWQDDMLRFLAERRDARTNGAPELAASTRRWLRRLVKVVEEIEDLRTTDDPVLGGPPPEKLSSYRTWVALRSRHLEPLEIELDELFHDVHSGHAPDLGGGAWVTRFLSCLIVCEQYFDERVRLGEAAASHSAVAAAQWTPIRAAAQALSAIP